MLPLLIVGFFGLSIWFFMGGMALLWSVFLTLLTVPFSVFNYTMLYLRGRTPRQLRDKMVGVIVERHDLMRQRSELLRTKRELLHEYREKVFTECEKTMNNHYESLHCPPMSGTLDENGIPYL